MTIIEWSYKEVLRTSKYLYADTWILEVGDKWFGLALAFFVCDIKTLYILLRNNKSNDRAFMDN